MDAAAHPPRLFHHGGRLRALIVATRLGRDPPRVGRAALGLAALSWLPLMVVAAVEQLAGGPVEPTLSELAVHVRLLIAIPLFLVAAALLEARASEVVERLAGEELVPDNLALFQRARRIERLAVSTAADLILIGLAILLGQLELWHPLSLSGPLGGRPLVAHVLGPAAIWYGFVAFPIFCFLGLRMLYRWLLWAIFLWRLSRLPLRTEPHPDHAGGLAFLSRPTIAIATLLLAMGAVFAASWVARLQAAPESGAALGELFAVWLGLALVIALGPLVVFVGCLIRTRNAGHRDYGQLALTYARRFRARWLGPSPGPDLLGTSDIQALNDMAGSFRVAEETRPLPFGARELILVILAAAVPMLPLLASRIPLPELLFKILRAVVG
ncbi:MAG TPA: hypothetical protein VII38_08055 [Polyangia bacterium]